MELTSSLVNPVLLTSSYVMMNVKLGENLQASQGDFPWYACQ